MVEVLFKHTWTPSYLPAGGVLPHFPNSEGRAPQVPLQFPPDSALRSLSTDSWNSSFPAWEGRALPSPAPSPVPPLRPRLHAVETVGEIRH